MDYLEMYKHVGYKGDFISEFTYQGMCDLCSKYSNDFNVECKLSAELTTLYLELRSRCSDSALAIIDSRIDHHEDLKKELGALVDICNLARQYLHYIEIKNEVEHDSDAYFGQAIAKRLAKAWTIENDQELYRCIMREERKYEYQ